MAEPVHPEVLRILFDPDKPPGVVIKYEMEEWAAWLPAPEALAAVYKAAKRPGKCIVLREGVTMNDVKRLGLNPGDVKAIV